MDFKIEDTRQETVQDDRKAAERRVQSQTTDRFKQAMAGAQVRVPLEGKDKKTTVERARDLQAALRQRDGKKDSPAKEGIKLDELLGQWQREDNASHDIERSVKKRDAQAIDDTEPDYDTDDVSDQVDEKRTDESEHQLQDAVVGRFGSQDGSSRDPSDSDEDNDHRRSGDDDEVEAIAAKRKKGGVRGTFATLENATPISTVKSVEVKAIRPFTSKFPKALLDHLVKKCHVVISGEERVVELVLSRHLFDGLKIRVTLGGAGQSSNSPLHIELITHSKEVAAHLEANRASFVSDLEKRGLAVSPNHVIVTCQA